MNEFHNPVLLKRSVKGLKIKKNGFYVDSTYGGGGHSKEILKNLGEEGKLVAFDQDDEAIDKNIIRDERLIMMNNNFRYMKNCLNSIGINEIDGIIADLGISSHQINTSRGFSFNSNQELDMRMNKHAKFSAQEILKVYDKENLSRMFNEHADFKNCDKLAEKLISYRKNKKIITSDDLINVFSGSYYYPKRNQFFARIFQAIRIEVNDEINALKELLNAALEILKPGGRLVVISYHSIEDRLVKNFMKFGHFQSLPKKDLFGNKFSPFNLINKKPLIASSRELSLNSRSRSAKLRIAELNRHENK